MSSVRSIFLILCLMAGLARATDFQNAGAYTLPANRALTNETWLLAHSIDLRGTARDDCFLFADTFGGQTTNTTPTLFLSGTFGADLWAAGETVELTGTVADHARLIASKTLSLNGKVGHNVLAFGTSLSLGEGGVIGGDATLAGQEIILNGTVTGNTSLYGNKVTLAGRFGGNVNVTAEEITVMPGTRIAGNLTYRMDKDLVLDSNVTLGGHMIKTERIVPESTESPLTTLMIQLALYSGAILFGLVFVSLMPGIVALSVHKLGESVWRCLLFGFVTFCLMPMAAFFLLFTLVGIPLSVMILLCYTILLYSGKIITALFVGHLLVRRKSPLPGTWLFPVMALGLLVLYVAANLPFPFDITCRFMITLTGVGAIVSAILDRRIPVMVSAPQGTPPQPPPIPPPGAV